MARITVEDCRAKVPNRFELVVLATKRAHREIVTALRELAAGKVRRRIGQQNDH